MLDPEVKIPLLVTKIRIDIGVHLHSCSDDRNGDGNSDTEVSPEHWVDALENILPSFQLLSIVIGTNPAFCRHCFYSVN